MFFAEQLYAKSYQYEVYIRRERWLFKSKNVDVMQYWRRYRKKLKKSIETGQKEKKVHLADIKDSRKSISM